MKLKNLVAYYLGYDPQPENTASTPTTGNRSIVIGSIDNNELPLSVGDWPAEWKEAFEERSAIIEFDGNINNPEAEKLAEESVRLAFKRQAAGVNSPQTVDA